MSPEPKGALAGITLGYNLQTGTWLWGAEGDIDWSGMKGSADCAGAPTCETKNTWLGTARGRLGYAGWNNWLPYITGGAAFGDIKATTPGPVPVEDQDRLDRPARRRIRLRSNWSVKLEYLYVDLGKFDCGIACGATDNVSFNANIVRAGVNYRF